MLQMIRKTKAWVENVDFGDNEQNLSAFYVQAIALVLIIGAILIGITYAIVGNVGYVILMMLVVVTHILVIVLTRRKSLNSAIYLFLIFSLGLEIYGLFLAGGIHATSSVLFPVILIFSSLLLDRKRFLIYTTFCLGAIAFIIYAENQKISQPYVPDQPELPLFISFGLIFVVTAIFVRFITENLQTNLRNTWQREQELATQNEILNRIGQAVVACASNSTITYWNQAASEYYGWNANDTLGKEYATILPVTNSPETMQMIDAALSAGKVWSGELNVKKRDQTLLRTLNTIAPLHNNQGHMTGWVGIAADLSERQQAELALQESEAKFHGFFNHSLDSMFLVDDNGLILEINQATEALFQLTREEAIGKPVWEIQFIRATDDVRTTTSMEAIRDIVEKATRTGLAPWLNRVTHSAIQLSDGAIRYIQQTSFTIPHGNKFWIAIISHDVTESRKVEDAIRMLNVELEKRVAERTAELESANRELESLSYTIGHDLRSPIRATAGYSHMLLDELSDHLDSSQKDKLQKINKVSRRMGHMVDDFLTFLRLSRSPMKKQKVSILMLVDQIVEETKNKQAAERKVILSVSPLPDCYADLYMITDVFSRLISNALKFSAPRDPALIEIGISEQQGETCYFVRDNGVGFDMKYSGKLFGVFQRLHGSDEFEGIGMGLAIVQRIIHRHGGRIWAVSQPDQGAAVYFTLTGSVQ